MLMTVVCQRFCVSVCSHSCIHTHTIPLIPLTTFPPPSYPSSMTLLADNGEVRMAETEKHVALKSFHAAWLEATTGGTCYLYLVPGR